MTKLASTLISIMLSGLVLAGCGAGPMPSQSFSSSRLPGSNEIDTWVLSGPPRVINNDTALYNEIDGAAPKYIERGWVSSVYATYQQGGSTIQVAVHDMATSDNAQVIFFYDLPVSRVQIDNYSNAVVDVGLATAYQAKAVAGQYYIEVSIDDHSDGALDYVKRFTLAVISR
jgi:ABC-type glycerol-3-phosphate transport system substrate-binding protein